MERSEQVNELAAALAKAQGAIANAPKDGAISSGSKRYRYATLASIWDACRTHLSTNNLAVTQGAQVGPAGITLTTLLMHGSGQFVSNELVMPISSRDEKGIGQAMTYARKYALAAMVGVAPDDDEPGRAGAVRESASSSEALSAYSMSISLGESELARRAYLSRTFGVPEYDQLTPGQIADWAGYLRLQLAQRNGKGASEHTAPPPPTASAELPAGGATATLQEALAGEQRAAEAGGLAGQVNGVEPLQAYLSALESFLLLRFPDTGDYGMDNKNRNGARKAILEKHGVNVGGLNAPHLLSIGTKILEGRVADLVEKQRAAGATCAGKEAPAGTPGGKS